MAEIFSFQKALEKRKEKKEKQKKSEVTDKTRDKFIDMLSILNPEHALLLEEIKDKLVKIEVATRQCSPFSLSQAEKEIQKYSTEELTKWITDSTQRDWLVKPAFFRAIARKYLS